MFPELVGTLPSPWKLPAVAEKLIEPVRNYTYPEDELYELTMDESLKEDGETGNIRTDRRPPRHHVNERSRTRSPRPRGPCEWCLRSRISQVPPLHPYDPAQIVNRNPASSVQPPSSTASYSPTASTAFTSPTPDSGRITNAPHSHEDSPPVPPPTPYKKNKNTTTNDEIEDVDSSEETDAEDGLDMDPEVEWDEVADLIRKEIDHDLQHMGENSEAGRAIARKMSDSYFKVAGVMPDAETVKRLTESYRHFLKSPPNPVRTEIPTQRTRNEVRR